MPTVVYRPEFVQALLLLGKVCRIASNAGGGSQPPVLVGGAVVEFDTAGQFMSGDFDFVTGSDRAFVAALRQMGFIQDRRPGVLHRAGGWLHPTLLIGVDMVFGALFDGRTDRSRLRIVDVGDGEICMPPTEDMIADRIKPVGGLEPPRPLHAGAGAGYVCACGRHGRWISGTAYS